MDEPTCPPDDAPGMTNAQHRSGRARTLVRSIACIVGLLAAVAAVVLVVDRRDELAGALASLRKPSIPLVAAMIALPLGNLACTSVAFWAVTRRLGSVGLGEMHALIASSWLLNFLPLRPGTVGRFAYHRAVNRISITHSGVVLACLVGCSVAGAAIILPLALIPQRHAPLAASFAGLAALIATALLARAPLGDASMRVGWPRAIGIALAARVLDMLVWTLRYWIALRLLGTEAPASLAVALALVSQAAMLVFSWIGNGLGVREWAVGIASQTLASAGATVGLFAANDPLSIGLACDLLNRAAELLVAIPAGILGTSFAVRRWNRSSCSSDRQRKQSP